MKTDPKGVLTGVHYLDGDYACGEGAMAAGCRFVAGYPITPSTETAEWFASRIPKVGGCFIQMEDEIASIGAVIGASLAGVKSMTATSDPGFSYAPIHTVGGVRTNVSYYTDIKVPLDMIIGTENQGWRLITSQLNHERVGLAAWGINGWKLFRGILAWAPLHYIIFYNRDHYVQEDLQ